MLMDGDKIPWKTMEILFDSILKIKTKIEKLLYIIGSISFVFVHS